jgi:hypothetical protein
MSEDLSQKQQTALAELQRGATFKVAAEAAGVNRVTLYRWVKSDPSFRAAYNAWEQETCESARARLVLAADSAVSGIVNRLQVDPKFAFQVLKELGIFRQRAAGQIDPQRVRQEIELEMKLPELRSDDRVQRTARASARPSEPPQLTALRALLDQRKSAQQVTPEPQSQPAQEPVSRLAQKEPRRPEDISVGDCPDLAEWNSDEVEGG